MAAIEAAFAAIDAAIAILVRNGYTVKPPAIDAAITLLVNRGYTVFPP